MAHPHNRNASENRVLALLTSRNTNIGMADRAYPVIRRVDDSHCGLFGKLSNAQICPYPVFPGLPALRGESEDHWEQYYGPKTGRMSSAKTSFLAQ